MPLTASKIAHIKAKIALTFQGRSQPLTLVCLNPDGTTRTLTLTGILKPVYDFDPSFEAAPGGAQEFHQADALLQLRQADVDLPTLRSVATVSPVSSAGAEAFASRYIPTSIRSLGTAPGGDRWIITLERQRA